MSYLVFVLSIGNLFEKLGRRLLGGARIFAHNLGLLLGDQLHGSGGKEG